MKKLILGISFLVFIISCGTGNNDVAHTGICDGYDTWSDSKYVLPYPAGKSHKIMQGNCGTVSHFGSHQYAYDFDMSDSDSIIASRGGTVIKVTEGNVNGNGCPDDNHVYIKHSDGSVAQYLHLTKDGALVAEGAVVVQGDSIALAGNTGCSSGTHLHFVVFKDTNYNESLPINFKNTDSNARGLKGGKTYSAK